MMKKIVYVIMLCVVFIALPIYAIDKNAGTGTAQFLKIPVGARAVGMGGSFVGMADNIDAVYWNPAGLTQLETRELSFQHNQYFQDIRYEYLAVGRPLRSAYIALSGNYLYLGSDITRTTETSGGLLDSADAGKFNVADLALNLSYAYQMNLWWSVGATAKWLHLRNDDVTADGVAFDVGVFWKTPAKGLTLGVTGRNIGPRLAFISQRNVLPFNFALGASYKIVPNKLAFNVDVNLPIDNSMQVNLGGEYWIIPQWSVRGGWMSEDDLDNGWTAGTGFKYLNFTLDYAYQPRGRLGDTHRVSAGVKF